MILCTLLENTSLRFKVIKNVIKNENVGVRHENTFFPVSSEALFWSRSCQVPHHSAEAGAGYVANYVCIIFALFYLKE
jgi:hypothetical protein